MTKAEMIAYCDEQIANANAVIASGDLIGTPLAYEGIKHFTILKSLVEAAISDPVEPTTE